MPNAYNWVAIIEKAKSLAQECSGPTELAGKLEIPRSTLQTALKRLDVSLVYATPQCHVELGLQRTEGLNELSLSHTGELHEIPTDGITTLEQLLELGQVDLNTWYVERWKVNKWPLGAKSEWKDLKWTDGRISGWTKSAGLQVAQLIQVTAWLARRKPIARFPTIQPVECHITEPLPVQSSKRSGYRRSLLFGDPHFWFSRDFRTGNLRPFHDRRALDIALQVAVLADVDHIDVVGDLFDMTDCTDKFLRTPDVYNCFQPAILEAHHYIRRLREVAPTTLHQGNHDLRLEKTILTHFKAAYELRAADELELPPALSVERLLALDKLDVEWISGYPDDTKWLNDDVQVCHGEYARQPGDTAKAVLKAREHSVFFGHIHRLEVAGLVQYNRDSRSERLACSVGCTCHVDGRVPGAKKNQQWLQACVLVDYDATGELFSFTIIPIREGQAIWERQLIEARPVLPQLRKAYPDWNWGDDE